MKTPTLPPHLKRAAPVSLAPVPKTTSAATFEIWQVIAFDKGHEAQASWHESEINARSHVRLLERQKTCMLEPWTGPFDINSLTIPATKAGLVEWFNENFSGGDMCGNLPGWYKDVGYPGHESNDET